MILEVSEQVVITRKKMEAGLFRIFILFSNRILCSIVTPFGNILSDTLQVIKPFQSQKICTITFPADGCTLDFISNGHPGWCIHISSCHNPFQKTVSFPPVLFEILCAFLLQMRLKSFITVCVVQTSLKFR